jgi:hypothetical protein
MCTVNRPQQRSEQHDAQPATDKPAVEDKHREKAKEMAKSYIEDRPTVVMPDTGGTVSGTAVADWVSADERKKAERKATDEDRERG